MRTNWDAVGVGLSGLCLAHCLVMPFSVILIPALAAETIDSEWTHVILIACALPVSLFAFWRGRRCHNFSHPGLLGGSGLALMASAIAFPVHGTTETMLTVAGLFCLPSATCQIKGSFR